MSFSFSLTGPTDGGCVSVLVAGHTVLGRRGEDEEGRTLLRSRGDEGARGQK